jgi:hypothetical protein
VSQPYVRSRLGSGISPGTINRDLAVVRRVLNLSAQLWRDEADRDTYGHRLRVAGVGFEDRKLLLGHKSDHVTTHYSAPEIGALIEASEKVCALRARKGHALTIVRARAEQQVLDLTGGERGTRTLDLGIMSSDFKQKSLLTQSLSDVVSGSVPVFVRISPGNFSYVRTKSDTVMGLTAEALRRNRRKSRGQDEAVRFAILGRARAHFRSIS